MTADTHSATLGALQMGTGNDNNAWGDNFNSAILAVLEKAIAGVATRTVTGGTLDLSAAGANPPNAASQMLEHIQIFQGTLSSDQTVIVPAVTKSWLVINRTAGNFGLLLKTPGGVATSVPQLDQKLVINADGSGNLLRLDRFQVGEIFDHGGTTAPIGSLECDGSAVSRTRYPDLFLRIASTWGDGDHVNTFNLPNLTDTGRHRRSRTGSLAAGTYQASQLAAHNHSATTSDAGSSIAAAGSHSHGGSTGNAGTHTHGAATGNAGAHGHTAASDSQGSHNHGAATGSAGNHNHAATVTDPGHAHSFNHDRTNLVTVGSGGGIVNVHQADTTSNVTTNTTGITVANSAVGDHSHSISSDGAHNHNITVNAASDHAHAISSDGDHAHAIPTDGSHSHGLSLALSTSIGSTGGSETRPECAVVIACIRI
jgi:hypothetical protein